MHPLPAVAPLVGFTGHTRLPRDYYLRVLGNDYSVASDPTVSRYIAALAEDAPAALAAINAARVRACAQAPGK